jgi:hypothetical protein
VILLAVVMARENCRAVDSFAPANSPFRLLSYEAQRKV